MRCYNTFISLVFLVISVITVNSCSKSSAEDSAATAQTDYNFKYADSIIYLRNQSGDYIVYPTEQRAGTYSGFPEGIELNEHTGAINVTKSETGLRYRITHTSPEGKETTTTVVLSGITYSDQFYRLSTGDSIASPVYNASAVRILPVAGSVFDDGNGANSGGCSIATINGKINLAATVRNGAFGTIPSNDARRDFDVIYKINDNSDKASNKLKVRIYYYAHMSDVAPDLLQTLSDRQVQGVFIGNKQAGINGVTQTAKPRPPCVIIIAN